MPSSGAPTAEPQPREKALQSLFMEGPGVVCSKTNKFSDSKPQIKCT